MNKNTINEIIRKALELKPHERYMIVECLMKSLEEVDEKIEEIWIEESIRRLDAYKSGKIKAVPIEEVFD